MAVQPGLCLTWSETLKTSVLVMQLIYMVGQMCENFYKTSVFEAFPKDFKIFIGYFLPSSLSELPSLSSTKMQIIFFIYMVWFEINSLVLSWVIHVLPAWPCNTFPVISSMVSYPNHTVTGQVSPEAVYKY